MRKRTVRTKARHACPSCWNLLESRGGRKNPSTKSAAKQRAPTEVQSSKTTGHQKLSAASGGQIAARQYRAPFHTERSPSHAAFCRIPRKNESGPLGTRGQRPPAATPVSRDPVIAAGRINQFLEPQASTDRVKPETRTQSIRSLSRDSPPRNAAKTAVDACILTQIRTESSGRPRLPEVFAIRRHVLQERLSRILTLARLRISSSSQPPPRHGPRASHHQIARVRCRRASNYARSAARREDQSPRSRSDPRSSPHAKHR